MLKQLNQFTFIYVSLLFINTLSAQTTIRVPADYTKIQDALNAAKANTTILVSPGTYYENLVWPNNIDEIKLIGIEGSSKTIIDGSKKDRVLVIDGIWTQNDEPIISHLTLIKGFTIRNGFTVYDEGAGIHCKYAWPTFNDLIVSNNLCSAISCYGAGAFLSDYNGIIDNCHFIDNINNAFENSFGAGLYMELSDSVIIKKCTFQGNEGIADSYCAGGGLFIVTNYLGNPQTYSNLKLIDCKFLNNSTKAEAISFGAGISISNYLKEFSCSIDSCQFINNSTKENDLSYGGAIYSDRTNLDINNSQFIGNISDFGPAIYYDNFIENNLNKLLSIQNSTLSKNTTYDVNNDESAIHISAEDGQTKLINVVIANNNSSPITIDASSNKIELHHCTIYNNEDNCKFGSIIVNAVNSIFWNKSDKEYTTPNTNHTYSHCIVKGGYSGIGIINSDPLLLEPNLPILTSQSPCINTGKLIPGIETDILGYPRVIPANSLPDIGAYEMDQYFAHAQVKFFYDVNQNKIRDGQERFLSVGSVSDNSGQEYVNFSESGRFIILPQGKTTLTYNSSSNPLWIPTGDQVFELDVNSDTYSKIIEIGLYPKEIRSQVATNVIGENFRCGEEVRFLLTATNYGTKIESGIAWLNIDERLDSIRFITNPDEKISDHNFGWQFRDLYPGESITIEFYVKAPLIDSPDQLGELYAFCHWISSEGSRDAPCYYAELRCSFDPNDKFSIPQREDHLSLIDKPLNYTIRFQNTGNDYARNVVIRDTIDPSFDLRTFKIINTSHPDVLNVTINASREIVFAFKNIFLPDSTTNLVGSNGHILYSIEYIDGIVPNTEVNNTANIFFDFNPAIVTNTTKNIIVTAFPSSTENISTTQVLVYPNPTNDALNFDQKAEQVMLYNMSGQLILQSFNTNKIQMNVNAGTYFVKLKINGKNSTHKVVVIEK